MGKSDENGMKFTVGRGKLQLSAQVIPMGDDVCVAVWGGERPHIGCSCLAAPHPSLLGDGSASATVSTLNLPGHRDDQVAVPLAKRLCAAMGRPVAVVCGFHIDHAGPDDIRRVLLLADELGQMVRQSLTGE